MYTDTCGTPGGGPRREIRASPRRSVRKAGDQIQRDVLVRLRATARRPSTVAALCLRPVRRSSASTKTARQEKRGSISGFQAATPRAVRSRVRLRWWPRSRVARECGEEIRQQRGSSVGRASAQVHGFGPPQPLNGGDLGLERPYNWLRVRAATPPRQNYSTCTSARKTATKCRCRALKERNQGCACGSRPPSSLRASRRWRAERRHCGPASSPV